MLVTSSPGPHASEKKGVAARGSAEHVDTAVREGVQNRRLFVCLPTILLFLQHPKETLSTLKVAWGGDSKQFVLLGTD